MTRPMPGPPEHDRDAHPHGDNGWCPICHHLTARRPYDPAKRLTDAECAAEAWHAEAHWARPSLELVMGKRKPSPELHAALHRQIKEAATWFKFTSHPHALEVTA